MDSLIEDLEAAEGLIAYCRQVGPALSAELANLVANAQGRGPALRLYPRHLRKGTPMPPLKLGTVQTVDMQTGEVLTERPGAMTLLPPDPDLCQECAVAHDPADPHNQQSLYYQLAFQAQHGRVPTWSDAMTHCAPDVQTKWRRALVAIHKAKNLDVPQDLHP